MQNFMLRHKVSVEDCICGQRVHATGMETWKHATLVVRGFTRSSKRHKNEIENDEKPAKPGSKGAARFLH